MTVKELIVKLVYEDFDLKVVDSYGNEIVGVFIAYDNDKETDVVQIV